MKHNFLKSALSIILATLTVISSFAVFAIETSTEPTTAEMEKVIKIVKPKLDIPDEASEFTWNYNAGNVYNNSSWRFTWQNKDASVRYTARADADGNIENFYVTDHEKTASESIVPAASISHFEPQAKEYVSRILPKAAESLVLVGSYSNGVYSKTYTYEFVREENGYRFPENTASVTLSYNTGELTRINCTFNYDAEFSAPEKLIGEQKAKELLETKQSMKLTYITVYETLDNNRIAKAQLVYAPTEGYSAVDAVTGEIYDSKSEWFVGRETGGAAGDTLSKNEAIMSPSFGAVTEDAEAEYELNENEKAQLEILEKLVSKDNAIKNVTGNKYLLIDPTLSAVEGYLNKSYQTSESSYQDDSGSYTWSLNFSNPVLNEVKSFYSYANATVNADNGNLVSFSSNLKNYWDYENAGEELPKINYTLEQAQEIAQEFLNTVQPEKVKDTVVTGKRSTNTVGYKNREELTDPIYGAYTFTFTRVNEGIEYTPNRIIVGVDAITGKVYNYSYRWNTNIEFESPKGIVSADEALKEYVASGVKNIYELKTSYVYTPKTNATKLETAKAFVLSVALNFEAGGDLDAVIEKYAKDIDREKLLEIIKSGDDDALLAFAGEYYGVKMNPDEVQAEAEKFYTDATDFYDRIEETRLVYTVSHNNISYIDAFSCKGVDHSGNEVTDEFVYGSGYTYDDISGHWAEETISLLGGIGIGFAGGKFKPEAIITGEEFCKLAESLTFYMGNSSKEVYKLHESDAPVIRIDGVKYILTAMDYDKVAVLENIFRTDFADNAEIKEGDIGYIAIAYALGIVHGNGTTMRTYDQMTRAEALALIVKAASAVK